MSKFIQLIDLDEIKSLRITHKVCDAYWSVPVPLGNNELPRRCKYCEGEKDVIPRPNAERFEKLVDEIAWAKSKLGNFNVSIELETEAENPKTNDTTA